MTKTTPKQNQSHFKLIITLLLGATLMFGFGFALVPIYNVMCKTLGINGKTNKTSVAKAEYEEIDRSRTITIEFLATNNNNLPWTFRPVLHQVKVHPGENKRVAYYAKNNSGHLMTIQAIPSVSPGIAAKYLRKTECFCFNQQTFKKGESMEMPILFHIDRGLPKNIHIVTLSYTIFDTKGLRKSRKTKIGKLAS